MAIIETNKGTFELPDLKELINLDYSCELSLFYKQRLVDLCKQRGITEQEALIYLLDYYYLDNANMMFVLSRQLRARLFQGVNRPFIIYLRLLYAVIGHFLKKLRYI